MPESVRLSVARNRHPSDHSFRLEQEQLEAHLGVEGAVQLGVFGGDVLPVMDRSHGLRLVRLDLALPSVCAARVGMCRPRPS